MKVLSIVLIGFLAYCLLPIAYCLLPIAYCLLPIAYCLLPLASCLLPLAFPKRDYVDNSNNNAIAS
ncbi:MAG: hypothetical protein F6K53_15240 [Moorea sp. SIO4A1]|uniref:hypothetical protein n=1 Tax=Moorena sp. SIO4A1 TaxID=2607835 RepID=UPI00144B926D|nr:hypothetical protein [Moorena sp. SIO4A1]NEQ58678.1 hypothetical protein [Moorena sp. SIO4A1]